MKQYLELAKAVKEKGTYKAPAREGMPGTTSLFGYQFRHDLSEGFPMLTTKKLSFKNIVTELLWFLRGDTNIKYLVDNGCNIWNEDAYNYYSKIANKHEGPPYDILPDLPEMEIKPRLYTFEEFCNEIKTTSQDTLPSLGGYTLGDCGKQYGWLWRRWETGKNIVVAHSGNYNEVGQEVVDQIRELIKGLKNNPLGRRHIISAWNPTSLDDMALNACHALVQFNCRPLSEEQKEEWRLHAPASVIFKTNPENNFTEVNHEAVPEYYLDCQMYQRSADLFLGVPYNIASYALLTHILCKVCNMVPGDFIHSFGDVHIYDNHMEQINEQLIREPKALPQLVCLERNEKGFLPDNLDKYLSGRYDLDDFIDSLEINEFRLRGYDSHPSIKGELSTGFKK